MLPIIGFGGFSSGDAAQRQEITAEICAACENKGFLYLKNHGVSQGVIDAAFSAVETYFAQLEAALPRQSREPGHCRGYIPTTAFSTDEHGGPPVFFEAFVVGADVASGDPSIARSNGICWPTPWPDQPAEFRPALTAYWDAVTDLAEDLARAFALARGLPEKTFTARFNKPISNMSLTPNASSPFMWVRIWRIFVSQFDD